MSGKEKIQIKKTVIEVLGTILGAFIIAVAVSLFLLPNKLSSGGVAGVATITYYLLSLPMGISMLIINIPLFLMSILKIGKTFFMKSILGTVCLSVFIDILDKVTPLTSDKFLACIYGGILMGVGTAILLKVNSSTGGTDLFAAKQEASQMANLNEVTFKRSNTGDDLYNTLHNSGWYNQASWTRGMTDISKQAVQDVLVNGKRTLPRYVTEHDMFPGDIENPKERSEYKKGDPVRNKMGSSYKFYDFFGKNKDGDISGYFDKDYETYKDDKPWGAGSGLHPALGSENS